MHPLVRQPQQACRVAGAHLQPPGSQDANGASSRHGGAAVFLVGPLSRGRVRPDRSCRRRRQLHVIHEFGGAGIVDEQFQGLADTTPCLIHGSTLGVAAPDSAYGGDPPSHLIPLVRDAIGLHDLFNQPFPRHGSKSRSIWRSRPGPMSSPACTGTVATHRPHSMRRCEPRRRISSSRRPSGCAEGPWPSRRQDT
jgi:hypothetical protein